MKIRSSSMNSTATPASSSSHSSILTHSFPASETSNSASPSFSSSPNSITRCEGLDLLVMAVHYMSGSAMGIPFVQKRVIRRRKRAVRFSNLIVTGIFSSEGGDGGGREGKEEEEGKKGFVPKPKRQKRAMTVPSKYQDSVLQPWKRQSRRPQQSTEIGGGSGQ